ncbi:hypothetical protein C9374_004425 [Naegleria lovaniensis]|uniref:Uncharacterized protein n=1 Tax=Naegleria lovaniensis TaxID=51637 RepID=A0AA88KKJ9_NAELO|nr:uncharacterized protein C9374_004425 [Naegleria lovaniensis]KAG2383088.1 hypothetical protein C9374_004425 [Naegleria lovaniensis]
MSNVSSDNSRNRSNSNSASTLLTPSLHLSIQNNNNLLLSPRVNSSRSSSPMPSPGRFSSSPMPSPGRSNSASGFYSPMPSPGRYSPMPSPGRSNTVGNLNVLKRRGSFSRANSSMSVGTNHSSSQSFISIKINDEDSTIAETPNGELQPLSSKFKNNQQQKMIFDSPQMVATMKEIKSFKKNQAPTKETFRKIAQDLKDDKLISKLSRLHLDVIEKRRKEAKEQGVTFHEFGATGKVITDDDYDESLEFIEKVVKRLSDHLEYTKIELFKKLNVLVTNEEEDYSKTFKKTVVDVIESNKENSKTQANSNIIKTDEEIQQFFDEQIQLVHKYWQQEFVLRMKSSQTLQKEKELRNKELAKEEGNPNYIGIDQYRKLQLESKVLNSLIEQRDKLLEEQRTEYFKELLSLKEELLKANYQYSAPSYFPANFDKVLNLPFLEDENVKELNQVLLKTKTMLSEKENEIRTLLGTINNFQAETFEKLKKNQKECVVENLIETAKAFKFKADKFSADNENLVSLEKYNSLLQKFENMEQESESLKKEIISLQNIQRAQMNITTTDLKKPSTWLTMSQDLSFTSLGSPTSYHHEWNDDSEDETELHSTSEEDEIKKLKKRLKSKDNRIMQLSAIIEEMEVRLKTMHDPKQFKEAIMNPIRKFEAYKQQIAALESETFVLQKEIDLGSIREEEHIRSKNILSLKIEDLSSRLRDMFTWKAQQEAKTATYLKDIETMRGNVEKQKDKVKTRDRTIDNLKQQLSEMKKKLEEKQAPPLPTPTPTIISHSVFSSNCKDMEVQTDTSFLPKTHFKTFNDSDLLSSEETCDKSTQTSPHSLDSIEISVTSPKPSTLVTPSSSSHTIPSKPSTNNTTANNTTTTKSNTITLTSYSSKSPSSSNSGTKKPTETSTTTKTNPSESSQHVNTSTNHPQSSILLNHNISATSETPTTSNNNHDSTISTTATPTTFATLQQTKQEEPPLDLDDPDFAVRKVIRPVQKKQSNVTPSNNVITHSTGSTSKDELHDTCIQATATTSTNVKEISSSVCDSVATTPASSTSSTETVTELPPDSSTNESITIAPKMNESQPILKNTPEHNEKERKNDNKLPNNTTTNVSESSHQPTHNTHTTQADNSHDHGQNRQQTQSEKAHFISNEQHTHDHTPQHLVSSLEYTRGDSPIFYDIAHLMTKDEPPEETEEEKALHQHTEPTWYKIPKSGHSYPTESGEDPHENNISHHSSINHHQDHHHHATKDEHSAAIIERMKKQARLKKVTFSHGLDDGEKMEILESKFKKRIGMATLIDRVLVSQEGKQLRIHGYNDYYYDEHGNLVYGPNHNRTNQNTAAHQDDKQGVRDHTPNELNHHTEKGTASTKLNVVIRKNLKNDHPQLGSHEQNNGEEGNFTEMDEQDGNNSTGNKSNKRGRSTPYGIHFGKMSFNKSSTIDNKNNMHPFTGRSDEDGNHTSMNNFSRNANVNGYNSNSVVRYGKKYFNSRDLMGKDGVDDHSDQSTLYIGRNPYSSNINPNSNTTNNGTSHSIHFDVNSQYAISNFPNRKSRPNSSPSNPTSSGHNSPTRASQIFVSLGQHIEHSSSQKEKRLKELKQEEQDKLEKILTTWNQMSKGHPESIEKLKEEYMNQLREEEHAHYYDIKESKVVSPSKKGGKSHQLLEKEFSTLRYSSNDIVNTYQASPLSQNVTAGTSDEDDSKVELNDTTITVITSQDPNIATTNEEEKPSIEFDLSDERATPTEMIMRPLLKIKSYQSPPKSTTIDKDVTNTSNNTSMDMTHYEQMLSMYVANNPLAQNSSPPSSPTLNRMQSSSSTCTVTLHQVVPIHHNPTLISTKSLPSVVTATTPSTHLTTTTPRIGAIKGRRITPTPPPSANSISIFTTTSHSTANSSAMATPLSSREWSQKKSNAVPYVISRSKSAMGVRERVSASSVTTTTTTRKKIKTADSASSLRSSMPTSGRSVSVADEREISKRKLKSLVGQ